MRWSIPTLVQRLVDQNIAPKHAGTIVALTYPETHGDTFYRWVDPSDPSNVAVGVYGLWNRLRGDQSPLGGVHVDDDARTIAQFLRLNPRGLDEIVRLDGGGDATVAHVVAETVKIIAEGGRFEPQEVKPDDPKETMPQRLASIIARADGSADYLQSLPRPTFGM